MISSGAKRLPLLERLLKDIACLGVELVAAGGLPAAILSLLRGSNATGEEPEKDFPQHEMVRRCGHLLFKVVPSEPL
jgi:hypothetical protein